MSLRSSGVLGVFLLASCEATDVDLNVPSTMSTPLIAFRAATNAAAASTVLTLTINVPTGTVNKDVMIAAVAVGPSTAVITAPAGWTLVRSDTTGAEKLATFQRVAGASEPASYAWTFNTSTGSVGGILTFSGVENTTPIHIFSGPALSATGNATAFNVEAPSVTTTIANAMLLTVHAVASSGTSGSAWTPPAGTTEAVDVSSATTTVGESLEVNHVVLAAAGASGSKTATMVGHDGTEGVAQIIALRLNNAPTANADARTVAEDSGATVVTVLGNDLDVDTGNNTGLTVNTVTQPANGTVTLVGGVVSFTPGANFNGESTFTYTITDGALTSPAATVTMTVTAVADTPTAVNDTATVAEDSGATVVVVLANDLDVDTGTNAGLTVNGLTPPVGGTVSLVGGVVSFTPNANFNGTTTFTYTITDGALTSLAATVTMTVTAVVDAPTAVNDTATVVEDSGATVVAVLANDLDVDTGNNTGLTINGFTQPASGAVSLVGAVVSYTPPANFNGTTTFTYTITDGAITSAVATVTMTVAAVNDAPTASNDAATVAEDSGVTALAVLANDLDVDTGNNTALTVNGLTQPANGVVTLALGVVNFTPSANFNGATTFTYTTTDGTLTSTPATVTMTVTAVNDAPTAVADAASVPQNSAVTVVAVLQNDVDIDSGNNTGLSVNAVTQPGNGVVTLVLGVVRFAPTADFQGTTTFTYTITDGALTSTAASVTMTVTQVNRAPTANNDAATVAEDSGASVIAVLQNDTDVDTGNNTGLAINGFTAPANGTVTLDDGVLRFAPNTNFYGTTSFTYTVTDTALTSSATVIMAVTSVNDEPVLAPDAATSVGVAVLIDVLDNDVDVDGDTLTITALGPIFDGSAVVDAQQIRFTPDGGFEGLSSFAYTVEDGQGGTAASTVIVTVASDGDGDGVPGILEETLGTDPAEADTDGDGLCDGVVAVADACVDGEGAAGASEPPPPWPDTDRDGTIDALDLDSDGDGLADALEGAPADGNQAKDTDGDGTPDFRDVDSDRDGVTDAVEGAFDTDDDAIGDFRDDDDDDDGIPTRRETSPFDLAEDEQSDGALFGRDVDGDGTPNHEDSDSDGDGVSDGIEGSGDSDGDGIPNYLDAAQDGVDGDSDGDALSNNQELDLGTNPLQSDSDGDRLRDDVEVGDPLAPLDSDGDDIIDALDADDDGDGLLTADEIADEGALAKPLDDDGVDAYLDVDSDGDGIPDATEGRSDVDGDGAPNFLDLDADGDGRADQTENDDDGDGIANFLDPAGENGPSEGEEFALGGGGLFSCASGGGARGAVGLLALLALLRRLRRPVAGRALLVLVCMASTAASAQAVDATNTFALERFRPGLDGSAILDVENGTVRSHLAFDVGLHAGYQLNPLVARVKDATSSAAGAVRIAALVAHRFGANLSGSIGLFEAFAVGIDLPLVLFQNAGLSAAQQSALGLADGDLSALATGDARIQPKAQVVRHEWGYVDVAVMPTLTLPTSLPAGSYAGEAFFTFAPEVAVSRSLLQNDRLRLAADVGYRMRPDTTVLNSTIGAELFYRAGVGLGLHEMVDAPVQVSVTLSGAMSMVDLKSSLEALTGVSWDVWGPWQAYAAAGAGLLAGFGTPDVRLLAGVRFSHVPVLDRDLDGVLDDVDACVDAAEDKDGFENSDGCPDLDDDKDGVPDLSDGPDAACRLKPEDMDGFEDADGCPDADPDACVDVPGVPAGPNCRPPDVDSDDAVPPTDVWRLN